MLISPFAFSGDFIYHTIEITSNPPGVDIEVNGEYIGQTPAQYTASWDATTQLGMYEKKTLVIKAGPSGDGQYPQTTTLVMCPAKEETMTKKVFFNMYSVPAGQMADNAITGSH
jgi:hypothetical protein